MKPTTKLAMQIVLGVVVLGTLCVASVFLIQIVVGLFQMM